MRKAMCVCLTGIMLIFAGCKDYVTPRESETIVETTTNIMTEMETETETVTEIESVVETELVETETFTETEAAERQTHAIWITEGVNIRAEATKSSDRLGGARFGEEFTAYIDTFGNDFVEIIYQDATAFIWAGCITTNYDVIVTIKAEQERIRKQSDIEITTESDNIIDEVEETSQSDTEASSEAETVETETETQAQASAAVYSAAYFKQAGVLNWGGSKWTWYTQRILPGDRLYIPDRHLDENGYVCDGDGYIVCAADLSYIPRYTVIETPLGKLGKIYDTGCVYGVIDVYTDW